MVPSIDRRMGENTEEVNYATLSQKDVKNPKKHGQL